MAVTSSYDSKTVHSPTHNRDNKSPPHDRKERLKKQSLNIMSDSFNLEATVSQNYTGLFDQDDDAGGGVPKRRDDSVRNSPDTSVSGSRERKELEKIRRQLNNKNLNSKKRAGGLSGEINLISKNKTDNPNPYFASKRGDSKGGDAVSSFR